MGKKKRLIDKYKKVKCAVCGKFFLKRIKEIRKHNFCCKSHLKKWRSERLSNYDKFKNPMNKKGAFTLDMRLKRREDALNRKVDNNKTYKKYLGRHIHRIIAEKKLGRPLRKGEVVHHIDGNIQNNDPKNLMVFKSQSEHIKFHMKERKKNGKHKFYSAHKGKSIRASKKSI